MIGSALTITRPRRNMYKVKYECACTHFRKTAGTIRSLIYSALTVLITSLQHEKVWIVTCERAHAHCRQGASNIHSHDPFTCDTHTHQWVVCTTHLHVNGSAHFAYERIRIIDMSKSGAYKRCIYTLHSRPHGNVTVHMSTSQVNVSMRLAHANKSRARYREATRIATKRYIHIYHMWMSTHSLLRAHRRYR